MCRPCRSGDQVAIGNCISDFQRYEGCASQFDFWCAGRIGIDSFTGDDAGGSQKLGTVAERGYGLIGF